MKETPRVDNRLLNLMSEPNSHVLTLLSYRFFFFRKKEKKNQYESSLVNEIFLLFIDLPQGVCSCLQISDIHLVSTLECTHCPMILSQQGSSIIIHLTTFSKHMIVTGKKVLRICTVDTFGLGVDYILKGVDTILKYTILQSSIGLINRLMGKIKYILPSLKNYKTVARINLMLHIVA